jgi:hypothetical protein
MKKEYSNPEISITSFEGTTSIMVSGIDTTQDSFTTFNYSDRGTWNK